MKRITLLILSVCIALCASTTIASAWGKIGHATIAQVAENHLTPAAKATLNEYLGGLKLAAIASDADTYRGKWVVDLGFVPTNPDDARVSFVKSFDFTTPLNISPYSHSITVDEDFVCYLTDNLDGKYINNAAFYIDNLAKELKKKGAKMSAEERYMKIALIVHLVGDLHCPMHIVYNPKNTHKGHIDVKWKKKEYSMHSIWDKYLFEAYYDWSFIDMAYLVDTATPEEIKKITKGDIYDYSGRSAKDSWPAVSVYKDGDILPESYATDMRPILFKQLRNGGYRLAAVLNAIFE